MTTELKHGWRWENFEQLRSTVVTAPNGVEYELRPGDITHPRAQRLLDAMFAALTQRPAAQTDEQTIVEICERIGFGRVQQIAGHAWEQKHHCAPRGRMGVTVRNETPAPQQATHTLADTLRKIDAASCKDCAATGYSDPGVPDSPDGPGRPAVVCGSCNGTGWRNGVHVSDQQATPVQDAGAPHLFEFWWETHMPQATQARAWAAWMAAQGSNGTTIEAAQQATPEPVGEVVAWLYTEGGETKFGHPQGHHPKDARPLVFGDTHPAPGVPDDIRALGWTVAVHNDYRLNGMSHTFWLFTKDGQALKGEGRTDAEALDQVRHMLAAAQAKGGV